MTKRKYIKPPDSRECVWRSGPPPEIGWWPADWYISPQPDCLRWWDGSEWSFCAPDSASASLAAENAALKIASSEPYSGIRWTDRWWEEK